jgi:hypothetical protein
MLAAELMTFVNGLVTEPVFINQFPDAPDAAVAIFEDGGQRTPIPGHYAPTLRILVRGTTRTDSAHASAIAIFDALDHLSNTTLVSGGEKISRCDAAGPPDRIEIDDNRRVVYQLTFDFVVSR